MSAEPLPLDIKNNPWVYITEKSVSDKYPGSEGGKWMMFYPRGKLNDAWLRACELYRSHQLTGIQGKKWQTKG